MPVPAASGPPIEAMRSRAARVAPAARVETRVVRGAASGLSKVVMMRGIRMMASACYHTTQNGQRYFAVWKRETLPGTGRVAAGRPARPAARRRGGGAGGGGGTRSGGGERE